MTVRVVYRQNGKEKSVEFQNEAQASIFMDGLNSRGPDHRKPAKFKRLEYTDKMTEEDWKDLREGIRSGEIPNPLSST